MVQAARSGRQNIAEGSVDSATSKKMEMKLTGVAKGSLEELQLDYQDFLRQRGLPEWPPKHPALERFKALCCSNLAEFRAWVTDEVKRAKKEAHRVGNTNCVGNTDSHGLAQTEEDSLLHVRDSPCPSVCPTDLTPILVANGALSLLNLCIYLLDRQLEAQARAFEEQGGFTERLYGRRRKRRDGGT